MRRLPARLPAKVPPISRRHVLLGLGTAGAALGLSACSDDSGPSTTGGPPLLSMLEPFAAALLHHPRDYAAKWPSTATAMELDVEDTYALGADLFARLHLVTITTVAALRAGTMPPWVDVEAFEPELSSRILNAYDDLDAIDPEDPTIASYFASQREVSLLYADQAVVALAVTADAADLDVGEPTAGEG